MINKGRSCQLLTLTITLSCALLIFVAGNVYAERAVDLDSPEDFARYQKFADELRCPKCQNQNLKDSNSPISEDLRRELARLIREGKTDAEIREFMVSRYGDFILYRTPVQKNTLVLWIGPVVMFGIGGLIFAIILFRRSRYISQPDNELAATTETSDVESREQDADTKAETENHTGNETNQQRN